MDDNRLMKYRLLLDRFLESADRTVKGYIGYSVRNRVFMSKLMKKEDTQKYMKQMLGAGRPFAIVRFGLYETLLCVQYLEKKYGVREGYSDFIRNHIDTDAGMFSSSDRGMDGYAELVFSLLPEADAIAYWRNYPGRLIFSPWYRHPAHLNVEDLYPFPFWHTEPLPDWQSELAGKRVAVVSAFSDTVGRQYLKREKIWEDGRILPDFELIPFRAVHTGGGRRNPMFDSWISAFHYMLDELKDIPFDLALISCGSYGMPLALALKRAGKCAIQWGGCFQLWFGIMGKRWAGDAGIMSYFNENWTYPSEEETPEGFRLVDGGSYWHP